MRLVRQSVRRDAGTVGWAGIASPLLMRPGQACRGCKFVTLQLRVLRRRDGQSPEASIRRKLRWTRNGRRAHYWSKAFRSRGLSLRGLQSSSSGKVLPGRERKRQGRLPQRRRFANGSTGDGIRAATTRWTQRCRPRPRRHGPLARRPGGRRLCHGRRTILCGSHRRRSCACHLRGRLVQRRSWRHTSWARRCSLAVIRMHVVKQTRSCGRPETT